MISELDHLFIQFEQQSTVTSTRNLGGISNSNNFDFNVGPKLSEVQLIVFEYYVRVEFIETKENDF